MSVNDVVFALAFLFAAGIYASVGHAGASAYLAVMALAGVAPETMRPTALSLNVLVAAVATQRFYTARCFAFRTLWPYALGSAPCAFLGGTVSLPAGVFRPILGVVLVLAAFRLAAPQTWFRPTGVHRPPVLVSVGAGAALGFVSGLTGVGGGIFLSPLLLIARWADVRETAGLSAAFILLNSISGLLGKPGSLEHVPSAFPLWAVAVLAGGIAGSSLGSRKIPPEALRRLLGVVLLVAAAKLFLD